MKKLSLLLSLFATTAFAQAADVESVIRDVRPLKLQAGEKIIVETEPGTLQVGGETYLLFDSFFDSTGAPLQVPARAVGSDRVLADVDVVGKKIGTHHTLATTMVTVVQKIDGRYFRYTSDARTPFSFDFFPSTLGSLANRIAGKIGNGRIVSWLGMTLGETPKGLQVKDVIMPFDAAELIKKYDRPPLDGEISRTEAQAGGMSDEEWKRLKGRSWFAPKDVLQSGQLEAQESDGSFASRAGLLRGDTIAKVQGKPVATEAEFEMAWSNPGDKIVVDVIRAGAPLTIDLPRVGQPQQIPTWIVLAIILLLAASIVALPVPVMAGLIVVWERKISAYMQSRIGPNRVGPAGWLQWAADGLKLVLKEDIIPATADPYLFRASPYLAFIGVYLTMLVIPFSHYLIVSDLNIGLLFLLSVTSLVVVSIIMGGWSSNSKWSLLGGMRSAAQIISYELPASVALLTVVTLTGSLSTQKIVEAQGGMPWNWYLFRNPFTFCAFFIWFISALAEGNRTPFDLPEAESELVSGYNTEYSGFRFSLFPLVEWVNLFIIGAVAAMLFLGGWRIPHVAPEAHELHPWLDILGFVIFLVKDIAIIFVIIWIRWTLPRFRVDQMMNLCWKYFIPGSFVIFTGVLIWDWLMPNFLVVLTKLGMFAVFGVAFPAWFVRRVKFNSKRYSDLVLNDALGS